MAAEALDVEDYLQAVACVLALAIFAVAWLAYRRRPTERTLLVVAALGLFALRGLFTVSDFFLEAAISDPLESSAIILEVGVLGLVTAALLKG